MSTSANEKAGQSGRKSGSLYFFSPPGGVTGTVVHRLDATQILPELRYNFAERIGFSEHWKLAAESSEFHLTLSRAYRAHFFQFEILKKRDILSEKRESGMVLKKSVSLHPKALMLTPM